VIDLKKVEAPFWAWKYFSTGDAVYVLHVHKKHKIASTTDKAYFISLSSTKVSSSDSLRGISNVDLQKYSLMSSFSYYKQMIRAIFS
jgi:hypothetical protein